VWKFGAVGNCSTKDVFEIYALMPIFSSSLFTVSQKLRKFAVKETNGMAN